MPAIYCADTWCDSCTDRIKADLRAAAREPADSGDERFYDSDEWPKYMGEDEEADTPQHCASGEDCLEAEVLPSGSKIGALLSRSLTEAGVQYVREYIEQDKPQDERGQWLNEVTEFWAREFQRMMWMFVRCASHRARERLFRALGVDSLPGFYSMWRAMNSKGIYRLEPHQTSVLPIKGVSRMRVSYVEGQPHYRGKPLHRTIDQAGALSV